jgi:hypothetical protein
MLITHCQAHQKAKLTKETKLTKLIEKRNKFQSYNSKISNVFVHVSALVSAGILWSGVEEVSALSFGTRAARAEDIDVTPAPLLPVESPTAAPTTKSLTTRMGLICYFPEWPDRTAPVIEFEYGVGSAAQAISTAYYMDEDRTYMSEDRYEPLEVVIMPQDVVWPIGQYQGGPITIIITGEAAGAANFQYHDYDGFYINDNNGEEEPVECSTFFFHT